MEMVFKVVVGILITALIILGGMVICLAIGALWSYIQDCLYDEWDVKLPPKKPSWFDEWVETGELTLDVIPKKIYKCAHCYYKTTTMSRCCPSCGRYMDNWDPDWSPFREED